ncbi:four-carbon acid sugar kinase family protein [Paraburkholderia sp. B3]|uniref:four-carbon acid sugar kinase family protein n=1 Tax=Paraburkholderia sp. B3 TaxID=3134791 RepID=UPI00398258E2
MSLSGLLIIADDLSGAADCAIAFASAGRATSVVLNAACGSSAAEVMAIDTDTRRLPPDDAARCTSAAWQAQRGSGRRLYKKIDSTLRGNWAAEVAALQALAGLAIVAPAFPATGRTVRDGRVFVRDVPLENTETWQLEHVGRPADLRALLAEAGLRAETLGVEILRGDPRALSEALSAAARSGAQALIVDAHTDADLRALAEATVASDDALFWVGSGGLARELAAVSGLFGEAGRKHPERKPAAYREGAVLVLVGSLATVSARQCALLREHTGIGEVVVPPAVLRAGARHPHWTQWQARIGAHLAGRADLLLRIGRDEAFDPAEGAQLSMALAALAHPFFAHLGGLIATGGETARAMLATAGIDSLQLLGEIEPGVAVARPHAHAHLTVVTKAGAFGSEHALYGAYRHLRGQENNTDTEIFLSPSPARAASHPKPDETL